MTRVFLLSKDGVLTGFRAEGHTGYAPEGKDIVCAGVSALIQSTVLGLTKLLKMAVEIKTEKKSGLFFCLLPRELSREQQEKADLLLRSMYLGLEQMAEEYRSYLQVCIKEVDTGAF